MDSHVVVKHLEPQLVAGIVIPGIRRAAVDAAFHGALPDVFSHLTANAIEPAGPPFARFHDADDGTFDIEIGIPVPADATIPETDTIKVGRLPGGEAATITHTDDLAAALLALAEWKADNARVSSGPPWQSYLDQTRAELFDPLT